MKTMTKLQDLTAGTVIRLDSKWQNPMTGKVETIETDANGITTVRGKWLSGNHPTPDFEVTSMQFEAVQIA